MKKFIKTLIIILGIIFSITSFAKAEDNICNISATVVTSYTIIMPQSISLPFDNPKDIECCINFENLLLEDGYGLEVTLIHDNFKHTENSFYQFSYSLDSSIKIVTKQNKEACFIISVDEASLALSPPGDYTSKITLTIQYIKL